MITDHRSLATELTMRLDINLASQAYEDAREFWLRWGTALGAAAILTLALLTLTITDWFVARRDHAQIADLRAQMRSATRPAGRLRNFSASRKIAPRATSRSFLTS